MLSARALVPPSSLTFLVVLVAVLCDYPTIVGSFLALRRALSTSSSGKAATAAAVVTKVGGEVRANLFAVR